MYGSHTHILLNLFPGISQTHHRVSLFSTFKSSRHTTLPRNEAQRVTALRTTAHSLSPTLKTLGQERPDTRRSHPAPHTSTCKCTGPTSPMQGIPSHPQSPDVNLPLTHMTHVLQTGSDDVKGGQARLADKDTQPSRLPYRSALADPPAKSPPTALLSLGPHDLRNPKLGRG